MKIRDLVMITDSRVTGRVIRRRQFPTKENYHRFKWDVLDADGRTWHKLPDQLELIESAPIVEPKNNNQMELKFT